MAYILSFSPLSFSSSVHYEPLCLAGVGVGCACADPARTVARALRGGGAQLELIGVRDAVHAAQGHVGHLNHAHQAGRLRTEPAERVKRSLSIFLERKFH
jgi:hypothetical protein